MYRVEVEEEGGIRCTGSRWWRREGIRCTG